MRFVRERSSRGRWMLACLIAATACTPDVEERGAAAGEVRGRPSAPETGALGPLIPFHKDAIHAGVVWDGDTDPTICFWMRPSEYQGTHLVDPTVAPIGAFRPEFQEFVYGGMRFSTLLDGSVRSRIRSDIALDNALCFDMSHPDALLTTGQYSIEDLDEADFALNEDAFFEIGYSAGLRYNVFCAGHAVLPDGRWVVVGGHDKSGNSGIRKVNIFDPTTFTWAERTAPPVWETFVADPEVGDPDSFPSARDDANTDPDDPSDMRYQRWYPSAVTLPNGQVLVLSGTDQVTSGEPSEWSGTKVRQEVPEIYDPGTDRTIALENAARLFSMYPAAYVIQTGPGEDDWQVAVMTEIEPPIPGGDELRSFDPWSYNGNISLLDVQAALADPNVDVRGSGYWTFVDEAAHPHGAASVGMSVLDEGGHAVSQRVVVFGGSAAEGGNTASVASIDFSASTPGWVYHDDLSAPAQQNNAVVLPDGTVLIVGGRVRTGSNIYDVQLFDPGDGSVRTLLQTNVPRHDHSTALLLPDARVIIMGGNRADLVPGDPDAGVPAAQIYEPPYLFRGPRPVIDSAPASIEYGESFEIEVGRRRGNIASVVLVRLGPITHNWAWGNRSVRLAHTQSRHVLSVQAPAVPGLAVPGYYMLFVVNEAGVPSVARRVHLSDGA